MTGQPPIPGDHPETPHKDGQHAPFLAMWYQIRDALADLLIPVFAGLKVVWLIAFTPVHFFKSDLDETADLAKTHTPFDIAWRALSPEDRTPLDAAKFLFFGILTAALAGFGFDNTNRLSGLLAQSGALDRAMRQIPGLSLAALPLYILPKIFPVTMRRTLLALLLTHGLFILTGWLFRAGFTTILLFWSSLASRF